MSSLPFFLSGLWHERQLALKMGTTSFEKLTSFLSWAAAVSVRHSAVSVTVASLIDRLLSPFKPDYYTPKPGRWVNSGRRGPGRLVGGARLELARLAAYAPQTYVSANSTTRPRDAW